MTQVSAQEATKRYSIVSHSPLPVCSDGQELLLTNVIYRQEADILKKDGELKKGINQLWGELKDVSTNKVSKIHIQYRVDWDDGFVIEQANFKGNVGSQHNQRLLYDIILGWEYYNWFKTNYQ